MLPGNELQWFLNFYTRRGGREAGFPFSRGNFATLRGHCFISMFQSLHDNLATKMCILPDRPLVGTVFQGLHEKLILLTSMHEWRRHLAHVYSLGQDINVLSSSNQQCSTLSADVVSGWHHMTFAFMSHLVPLLHFSIFQRQIWMLSVHGQKKTPKQQQNGEWLQGRGIRILCPEWHKAVGQSGCGLN